MTKNNKIWKGLVVFLFGLVVVSGTVVVAATPAKQLAKGISLYNDNKDDKALDYFIDVLVNGNSEEVAQANKYISLIHNRMGGIQTPVEVDVNFKEGEVKSLDEVVSDEVEQAQQAARDQAAKIQNDVASAQQDAADAIAAEKQALTDRIENEKAAAQEQLDAAQLSLQDDWKLQQQALQNDLDAKQQALQDGIETQRQQALDTVRPVVDEALGDSAVAATLGEDALLSQAQADEQALADLSNAEIQATRDNMLTTVNGSAFTDLTSPQAIEARELYTSQKIASMTDAAMKKIADTPGVNLYMRDNRPDAIEIDPEVIFDKTTFRSDAQPLLNSIYELLALTQGSAYVILPPGSYTDDVTLPGIRQAMGLNSYLINRGISQGKLHYNMGLVDEEPPARFANLHGLSIVFDYDSKLPTVMEKNEKDEKAPLLSMAIVPLCHAIDRSLGEAFAIDFSVLETVNPLDNWVLQIVQHGHDGKFYIVRQLEGFSPVYHQILFNGRKGVIGPELPCGKYTLVLTGTDLKGNKQTLRRRVIVKCADTKNSCDGSCSTKAVSTQTEQALNYKAARLWKKPGRKMGQPVTEQAVQTSSATSTDTSTSTYTKTVNTTTIIQEDDGSEPASAPAPAPTSSYPTPDEVLPMNNPYDMPYEDL